MAQAISIITDNPDRSGDVARAVDKSADVKIVALDDGQAGPTSECELVIIDVPLSDPGAVGALREKLAEVSPVAKRLFVVDDGERRGHVQANFLGATETVARSDMPTRLAKYVDVTTQPDARRSVLHTERLNENMFDAVQRGEKLPIEEVEQCADLIAHNLKEEGIASWLEEVKRHHSYTHRHSMHVTGFAVAFGLHYKMRDEDVQRLATGAMLHDIGKAHIPIEILDKPTKLTREEQHIIRQHAGLSAEALERDGQFDPEVIDVARHHHEYLDGSGYPDGLGGGDISDLVRIVAIADVYSALVDQRAYKSAISRPKAFQMMLRMGGKLDPAFVRAFEPVALY